MAVTGLSVRAKDNCASPRRNCRAFSRCCIAPLSKRRRALYRLQIMWSSLSCNGYYHWFRRARRRYASNDTLWHWFIQVYFLRFLWRICPVDSIVETRVLEYHGEKRGDLIYTKEMLLAIGDRYEEQIAKDREADARYRWVLLVNTNEFSGHYFLYFCCHPGGVSTRCHNGA